jgi:hypothetical protein
MPDLQIAMRVPKIDRIHATRRFGAFAVLTLRAIEKIGPGRSPLPRGGRILRNRSPGTYRLRRGATIVEEGPERLRRNCRPIDVTALRTEIRKRPE